VWGLELSKECLLVFSRKTFEYKTLGSLKKSASAVALGWLKNISLGFYLRKTLFVC